MTGYGDDHWLVRDRLGIEKGNLPIRIVYVGIY
jgi:hypothetical protein